MFFTEFTLFQSNPAHIPICTYICPNIHLSYIYICDYIYLCIHRTHFRWLVFVFYFPLCSNEVMHASPFWFHFLAVICHTAGPYAWAVLAPWNQQGTVAFFQPSSWWGTLLIWPINNPITMDDKWVPGYLPILGYLHMNDSYIYL